MNAADVYQVLDALTSIDCRAWVGGGWGVDALAGRQTRPHRDLDLAFDAAREDAALTALEQLGYRIKTDLRPVRCELVAGEAARVVDLHPLVFDEVGNGTQAGFDGHVYRYPVHCFVRGHIGGREVSCLSITQQLEFHSGYPPRDIDLADIALLRSLATAKPPQDSCG